MRMMSKQGTHRQGPRHRRGLALALALMLTLSAFPSALFASDGVNAPMFSELAGATGAIPTSAKINGTEVELTQDSATVEIGDGQVTFEAQYQFEIGHDAVMDGKIDQDMAYDLDLPEILLPPGEETAIAEFKVWESADSHRTLGHVVFNGGGAYLVFDYPGMDDHEIADYLSAIEDGIHDCTLSFSWSKSASELNTGNLEYLAVPFYSTTLTLHFPGNAPSSVTMSKTGQWDENTREAVWTAEIVQTNCADTGVVFEDMLANQTYVADSLRIIGVEPSGNVSVSAEPGKLSCTFADALQNYANAEGKITLTYRTRPTAAAYADKDHAALTNSANLLKGPDSLIGTPAEADIAWTPLWLSKVGVHNQQDKTITWTLTINAEGHTLNNVTVFDEMAAGLSLKVDSITVTEPASGVTAGTPAVSETNNDSAHGDKFSFTLSPVTGPVKVTYVTDVSEAFYAGLIQDSNNKPIEKLTNNAYMRFTLGGGPGGEWTYEYGPVGVSAGVAPIAKAGVYHRDSHTVDWTVTVNPVKLKLKNATVTDEIQAGQTYVAGSAKIDGVEALPEPYEDASRTLTFALGDTTEGQEIKITYQTVLTEDQKDIYGGNDNSHYAKNKAELSAVLDSNPVSGEAPCSIKIVSNVLKKRFGDYDYRDKTIPVVMTINENKMSMPDARLTDVLDKGLSLAPGGQSVRLDGVPLAEGAIPGYTYDPDSGEVVIDLGNEADGKQATVTLLLAVDVDKLGKNPDGTSAEAFTLHNSAVLSRNGYADVEVIAEDKPIDCPMLVKNGTVDTRNRSVSYTILINQLGMDLPGGFRPVNSVTDTMSADLMLDPATIQLTRGSVDSDGGFVAGGQVSPLAYTYRTGVPEGKNQLTVTLPEDDPAGTVYLLSYTADIVTDNGATLTNEASFNGQEAAQSAKEQHTVQSAASGSGWLTRKALIKLKKSDAEGNPLEGAVFALLAGDQEQSRAASNGEGELQFVASPGQTYTIREVEAPLGYVIPEEWSAGKSLTPGGPGVVEWESGVTQMTVVNQRKTGVIEFVKRNDLGQAAPGAEYALFQLSDPDTAWKTAQSGENGLVSFSGVPGGDYLLRETNAPAYHQLDQTIYQVTMGLDGLVSAFQDGEGAPVGVENGAYLLTDLVTRATLTVMKQDESDGSPLAGAEFCLKDQAGALVGPAQQTDEDGKAVFPAVPQGITYTLEEVAAPAGYQLAEPVTVLLEGDAEIIVMNRRQPSGSGSSPGIIVTPEPEEPEITIPPAEPETPEQPETPQLPEEEPPAPEAPAIPPAQTTQNGGVRGKIGADDPKYYIDERGVPRGKDGTPDPLYWLDDNGVPLGYLEDEEWVFVDPEEVPLGMMLPDGEWLEFIPYTGDQSGRWGVAFLLFGLCLAGMTGYALWRRIRVIHEK